jgi:hypothetical protein
MEMTLSITEVLDDYLNSLERDLGVEVDLHGGRTVLARDLRDLIISTKKELDILLHGCVESQQQNKYLEGVKK